MMRKLSYTDMSKIALTFKHRSEGSCALREAIEVEYRCRTGSGEQAEYG